MPVSQRLELSLKQKQILAITQEMRLRIELLQKNVLDIREMIIEQAQENPFIEIEDWGENIEDELKVQTPEGDSSDQEGAEIPLSDRPVPLDGDARSETMSDVLAAFDWNVYQDHSGNNFGDTRVRRRNNESDEFSWEEVISAEEPVARRLDVQIAASHHPEPIKEIMTYMAYNLDERGFLRESDEEIAAALDVPPAAVASARAALRYCEPEGVGSRDVAEYLCFMFSGDPRTESDPATFALVRRIVSHSRMMDALAKRDFPSLCRELSVGKEDLAAALSLMRRISPYPFFGYESFRSEQVVPDLRVHLVEGEVVIEMEKRFIPSIRLARDVYEREMARLEDKRKREFLRERYRAAEWLVKSLSERNKTLYEVAASIFTFQKSFLEYGEEFLRPLTLKDVAADINRHQSTISRLTSGKYAVTPHGIYELKYFFVKRVNDESPVTATNRHLEMRLREIIAAEDKTHPLSDEDIARLLSREGIGVARRTIAKYRAKLKIPSAQERRRSFEFSSEKH